MHFSLQQKIAIFKTEEDIINIETGRSDNKKTLIINQMSTIEELRKKCAIVLYNFMQTKKNVG